MKKCLLILMTVVALMAARFSTSEAAYSAVSPFPLQSPDQTLMLTITDLGNGIDHAVVFFNNSANTAIAAVLDTLGNPDDSLLGNAAFLEADFSTQPATIVSSNETSAIVTSPFPAQAPDQIQLLSADQLNGFDHGVIFINNMANTAMAVVLDPNGAPDNSFIGYGALAADLTTGQVWGTKNGLAWYCISGCSR